MVGSMMLVMLMRGFGRSASSKWDCKSCEGRSDQ
jgi:hypothetical protein